VSTQTAQPWSIARLRTDDGEVRVGRLRPPGANATVLMIPGRGDSLELRADPASRLAAAGLNVVMVEHHGQAASPGRGRRPDAVHIDTFDTHERTVRLVADSIQGPVILLAHSMGGLIALHLLAAEPDRWPATVLTSPMWGFAGAPALPVVRAVSAAAVRLGLGRHLATGERPFAIDRCLRMRTEDRDSIALLRGFAERYPDLLRGGSTWGWTAAAARKMQQIPALPLESVTTRVTVLTCARDTTVDLPTHEAVAARITGSRLVGLDCGHDPLLGTAVQRSAVLHEAVDAGRRAAPAPPTR
jgi:lysophospholipase